MTTAAALDRETAEVRAAEVQELIARDERFLAEVDSQIDEAIRSAARSGKSSPKAQTLATKKQATETGLPLLRRRLLAYQEIVNEHAAAEAEEKLKKARDESEVLNAKCEKAMLVLGRSYETVLDAIAALQAAVDEYTTHARVNNLVGPSEKPKLPWSEDLVLEPRAITEDLLKASLNRWNEHCYLPGYVSDRSGSGARMQQDDGWNLGFNKLESPWGQ